MPKRKTQTALVAGVTVLLLLGLALVIVKHEHTVHLRRLQGAWEGALHFHGGARVRTQRIVLKVLNEHGLYHAVVDEVDLGLKDLPAAKFDAGRTLVAFALGSGFTYHGRLNGEATEIIGRWKWPGGGFSQPLTLSQTRTPDPVPEPLAQADYTRRPGSDLQGLWEGTLRIGTNSLRLRFKIAEPAQGTFRVELNSLDQPPIIPLPATTVNFEKPRVQILFQGIGALFDGQLDESGSEIAGNWAQARINPLTLTRVEPKTEAPASAALNAAPP